MKSHQKIDPFRNKILQGHAIQKLKELPANSVDEVYTSPPYWGLRDYGTEPLIWDDDPDSSCAHAWELKQRKGISLKTTSDEFVRPWRDLASTDYKDHDFDLVEQKIKNSEIDLEHSTLRGGRQYGENEKYANVSTVSATGFCKNCNAWIGQLGLEPDPFMYIQHLVQIFEEVKRVLKPTGLLFVNLGDSYASSGGLTKKHQLKNAKVGATKKGVQRGMRYINDLVKLGAKNKSQIGIPEHFKITMIYQAGWICRNTPQWIKDNAMPSPATDRFTNNTESIFFFVKEPKYYFEPIYEPTKDPMHDFKRIKEDQKNKQFLSAKQKTQAQKSGLEHGFTYENKRTDEEILAKLLLGKNKRSAWFIEKYQFEKEEELWKLFDEFLEIIKYPKGDDWLINTKPFPEAHFATFPPDLVRIGVLCGVPKDICIECGVARKKVYDVTKFNTRTGKNTGTGKSGTDLDPNKGLHNSDLSKYRQKVLKTVVDYSKCNCNAGFKTGVILDPFFGSGTVGLVALQEGRDFIGIELSPEYIKIAEKRLAHLKMQTRLTDHLDKAIVGTQERVEELSERVELLEVQEQQEIEAITEIKSQKKEKGLLGFFKHLK